MKRIGWGGRSILPQNNLNVLNYDKQTDYCQPLISGLQAYPKFLGFTSIGREGQQRFYDPCRCGVSARGPPSKRAKADRFRLSHGGGKLGCRGLFSW